MVNDLIENIDLCKVEDKNKGKDRERREIMNSGKETYFVVYFDQEGKVINVQYRIGDTGKMVDAYRSHIKEEPLPSGITEIHSNSILGKEGASPCCYVDQLTGYKFCWPPCRT